MSLKPTTTTVTLARHAMATRFELVLVGTDPVALRAAGEEALDEIERIEAHLSFYRPGSDISRLNRQAADQPVPVDPHLFALLQTANHLSEATDGAFDVTVAPLLQCWGFVGGTGKHPTPEALAQARQAVGASGLELDVAHRTVRFAKPGMKVDLGAIGKGYALDRAVEVLRDAGVTRAFLHGGTSTACALGRTSDELPWKTAVELPAGTTEEQREAKPLAIVPLENDSLSVSAVWGKAFTDAGKTFGHVIDPRLGEPVQRALLAAVVLPSATESDALSTALLVLGPAGLELLTRLRPAARALVVWRDAATGQVRAAAKGLSLLS